MGINKEPVELGPGLGGGHPLAEGLHDGEAPGLGEALKVRELVVEGLVLGGRADGDGGVHGGSTLTLGAESTPTHPDGTSRGSWQWGRVAGGGPTSGQSTLRLEADSGGRDRPLVAGTSRLAPRREIFLWLQVLEWLGFRCVVSGTIASPVARTHRPGCRNRRIDSRPLCQEPHRKNGRTQEQGSLASRFASLPHLVAGRPI